MMITDKFIKDNNYVQSDLEEQFFWTNNYI